MSSVPRAGVPTLEESEESVESRALQHILPAGPQSLLIPATLAALHKVNLPLKIWYLLTCLMELDGCLTFIEFFLQVSPVSLRVPRMLLELERSCRNVFSSHTQTQTTRPGFLIIILRIKPDQNLSLLFFWRLK